jgi:predicted Zn finger-like uncharacterized protein
MALLTLCPNCKTVFRVHAAQLSAARGFVECGACGHPFNALDHLADEPHVAAVAATAPGPADSTVVDDLAAVALDTADIEGPRVGAASLNDLVIAEASPPMPRIELAQADALPSIAVDDAPAILREDLARLAASERRGAGWAWGLLALVLLGGLVAQAAWYWRIDLLARYPQLAPHAARLCEELGCRIEQPASKADIELVARDVRDHPQYAQTLLVNATLLNRARLAAAYPVIQLSVYDRRGAPVGVRRFQPREYLDRSIDIEAGMPAGRSVYIVLEIAGIGDRADSFEFLFL